jgi:hypothetical protein
MLMLIPPIFILSAVVGSQMALGESWTVWYEVFSVGLDNPALEIGYR